LSQGVTNRKIIPVKLILATEDPLTIAKRHF